MKPPRFLLVLPVLVGLSACAVGNSALPHEHLAIAKLGGGGTARITVRWPKAWALKAMPEATSSLQINVWDATHTNKLDTVTLVRTSEAQVSTSLPRTGGATLPAGELLFEAIAFDYNGNLLDGTTATATLATGAITPVYLAFGANGDSGTPDQGASDPGASMPGGTGDPGASMPGGDGGSGDPGASMPGGDGGAGDPGASMPGGDGGAGDPGASMPGGDTGGGFPGGDTGGGFPGGDTGGGFPGGDTGGGFPGGDTGGGFPGGDTGASGTP